MSKRSRGAYQPGEMVHDDTDSDHSVLPWEIPPQPEPFYMSFYWGGYTKSDTGEQGPGCFLLLGVPTPTGPVFPFARLTPYVRQAGGDPELYRADGMTEYFLLNARTSYTAVTVADSRNSTFGNVYLRARFQSYARIDWNQYIDQVAKRATASKKKKKKA